MSTLPMTPQELQDFIDWTRVKIKLHTAPREHFPHKREIWWISFGKNIGVEINGKHASFERPALVVRQYSNNSSLVLPISSKKKEGDWFFVFQNIHGQESTIYLSQLKTASHKRFLRKVGKLDAELFSQIEERLKRVIFS